VLERGTDRPVPSAIVELRVGAEVRSQARTFDDGTFMLAVPGAGTYRVAASRMGYESLLSGDIAIGGMDSVSLVFRITASAAQLDRGEATPRPRLPPARLAGFYERSGRRRQGHFLTRSAIDHARAARTSDLLRRIPGLAFRATRKGGVAIRGRGDCEPQV